MAKLRKKFNLKSMKTWKKILVIGLACITLVGAIAGISALFRESDTNEQPKTNISSSAFSVGGLTEDGKFFETESSIYTKDAFECQGLTITPDFESTVKYQVYFYAPNYKFMSSTDLIEDVFTHEAIPTDAQYARIVITPNDDQKISWYEVSGYARQLDIQVYKEQNYIQANLFALGEINEGQIPSANTDKIIELKESSTGSSSVKINVKDMNKIKAIYSKNAPSSSLTWMFADSSNKYCGMYEPVSGAYELTVDVPANAEYVYIIFKTEFIVNQVF